MSYVDLAAAIREAVQAMRELKQQLSRLEGFLREDLSWRQAISKQIRNQKERAQQPPAAPAPARAPQPIPQLTEEDVKNCVRGVGLDPDALLSIVAVNNEIMVTPKMYLGDQWAAANDALKAIGARWYPAGKTSHWKISKIPPEG